MTFDRALAEAKLEVEKRDRLAAARVDPAVVDELARRHTGRRIQFVCWTAALRNRGPGFVVRALRRGWTFGPPWRRRRRTR